MTEVYYSGMRYFLDWKDAVRYDLGLRFLEKLALVSMLDHEGGPFFYLETKDQLDAMWDFRRSIGV